MTTAQDLFLSILAMDAYNRGYAPKLDPVEAQLGTALVLTNENLNVDDSQWQSSSFYASAYQLDNGEVVVSYRGTDVPARELVLTDFPLMDGTYYLDQVQFASAFYNSVRDQFGDAPLMLTGHSLGGALAGFTAGVYGQSALLVDHIGFDLALDDFVSDYLGYLEFRDHPAFDGSYFVANRGFVFDMVEFLEAMGIDPSGDIVPGSATLSSFHLAGSITDYAAFVRGDVSSTALHDGIDFNPTGSLLTAAFATHSAAWNVIFKYAELYEERAASAGIDGSSWEAVQQILIKSLYDEGIALQLGETGDSPADILANKIAYSAVETGARPFGDTGVKAMFNDAAELGSAQQDNPSSVVLNFSIQAISDTIVTYAGALASEAIGYDPDAAANGFNPLEGVVNYFEQQDRDFLSIDFGTETWGFASAFATPFEPSFTVLDELSEYALFGEDVDFYTYDDLSSETIYFGIFHPVDPEGTGSFFDVVHANSITIDNSEDGGSVDLSVLPNQDPSDIYSYDVFAASNGSDTITGSDGNNVIFANGGNDVVAGNGGNDVIVSGRWADGNDYFFGGDGDDTLISGYDLGLPNPGNGIDILEGGAGDDYYFLGADAETDIVIVGSGKDQIVGGDANDRIFIRTSDLAAFIDGSQATGSGTDAVVVRPMSEPDGTGPLPFPAVVRFAFEIFQTLMEDDEGNTYTIDNLRVYVYVGSIQTTLPPESEDTFAVFVIENFVDGMFGIDLSQAPEDQPSDYLVTTVPEQLNLVPSGEEGEIVDGGYVDTPGADLVGSSVGAPDSNGGDGGLETINGTGASETINGTGLADLIDADGGHDTVNAGGGNDTIIGGTGNDNLFGGDGDDTFEVGVGHGFDDFDGGAGTDRVIATAAGVAIGIDGNYANNVEEFSANGHSGVTIQGDGSSQTWDFSSTTLTGIEAINGGAGHDTITGSAGNDTIIGGTGNDNMFGGDGNDTFEVGAGHGFDDFDGGAGFDRVIATAANVAIGIDGHYANNVEEFSANGFAGVTIQGDGSSQTWDFSGTTLTGITAIDGGSGHDTISGSASDDTIIGGTGNDNLFGGDGDDTFEVGAGHGYDDFDGGAGNDRVVATTNNVAIGIDGHYANNVEEFSANGFAGVTIQGDGSSQTWDFSSTTLTGITAINGGSGHDTITGSAGNDTIIGGTGNDNLFGGDGDDTFEVGSGHGYDDFDGGDGFDRVVATAANIAIGIDGHYANNVEEFSADGFSGVTIQGDGSSQTWDFSSTTLTGITAINGGSGHDTITGSAGNDTIIGGTGNDNLFGGDGDDTFEVGAGHGYDDFDGGAGFDRVIATEDNVAIGIDGHYANNVEEFSADGFVDVTIQGDGSSQTWDFSSTTLTGITAINGGSGHDTITGSAGNDTIIGGTGNDNLFGGDGDDTFVFMPASEGGGNNTYRGGTGHDRLVVNLTAAEFTTALAAELDSFNVFASLNVDLAGENGPLFSFANLGLDVADVEGVDVYVDGVLQTLPSQSVNQGASTQAAEAAPSGLPEESAANVFSAGSHTSIFDLGVYVSKPSCSGIETWGLLPETEALRTEGGGMPIGGGMNRDFITWEFAADGSDWINFNTLEGRSPELPSAYDELLVSSLWELTSDINTVTIRDNDIPTGETAIGECGFMLPFEENLAFGQADYH